MMAAPELTVLLPALDEAESLKTLLPAVKRELEALGVAHEILVVDGGSKDATAAVAAEHGCRVLRQSLPGFGGAVREGLSAAKGGHILEFDADGSHPPAMIRRLWQARREADLVIASRYMDGGSAVLSLSRRILSRALNAACRWWLGWPIEDASSGLRIYRAGAVQGLALASTDFGIQQETLAGVLAAGGTAGEVPFRYEARVGGQSKARVLPLAASYVELLWRLKLQLDGPAALWALAGALALGLGVGLCGITWGLPGPARLRAFPDRLRPTPEIAQRFADSWAALYQDIKRAHEEMAPEETVTYVKGVDDVPPGWTFPPGKLANAYRSLLLQSENPDEKKSFIILGQMRPWRLDFKPFYVAYGGAYIYPLGAWLAAASAAGAFRLTSDLRYFLLEPGAMRNAYFAGRLFALLFQLGSVGLLFALGRRLGGWAAGLLAAAFFVMAPTVVINSHVLKPYTFSAFFTLASLCAMLAAADGGRRRDYLWCGLWAGVAAGGNVACVVFGALPLVAWWSRRRRLAASAGELKRALAGSAAAAGAWLATNPFLVLAFRDYAWETTVLIPTAPRLQLRALGPMLASSVPAGLGWGLWLLALAGFALWLSRRDPPRAALGLAALAGFAFIYGRFWYVGSGPAGLRLYFPLIPFACLAAADAAVAVKLPRAARAVLLTAVLADLGLRCGVHLANMVIDAGPRSTRVEAARWIEDNVPEGATVGLTRYFEPAHAPYARYDRYHLVVFERPELLAGRLPDWIVVDQDGADEIDSFTRKNYHEAKAFLPARALWARVLDPTFFANKGIRIYRR